MPKVKRRGVDVDGGEVRIALPREAREIVEGAGRTVSAGREALTEGLRVWEAVRVVYERARIVMGRR